MRGGGFFQAEDGIRDVERSRGLGDVYKRQGLSLVSFTLSFYLVYFELRIFNMLLKTMKSKYMYLK